MKKSGSLSMNAMIACIYAILTIFLAPLSYGAIQMRISEILIFLAFYNKKYISGLVIGCFIANLASPMGMWDMIFGTLATLLATLSISKQKNLFVAAFLGALFNGIIIGLELHLAFQLPLVINMIYVFIGEFIVLLVGIVVCKWMEKNQTFMNKYIL